MKPRQTECPFCKAHALEAYFDGHQTYLSCTLCDFDSLLGDGDLTA